MSRAHDPDALRLTSRDRISHLEDNVTALWTALRTMDMRAGGPSHDGPPIATPQNREARGESESESDAAELTPANAPSHLKQLFDNSLVGSGLPNGLESANANDSERSSGSLARPRQRLQALLPCKQDVHIIAEYASTWMTLYHSLFTTSGVFKNGEDLVSHYDQIQQPFAQPVTVAAFLLSIAITAQHVPTQLAQPLTDIKDAQAYIREVSRAVEETIVSNDALAASLEGIETSLLFVRLYDCYPPFHGLEIPH